MMLPRFNYSLLSIIFFIGSGCSGPEATGRDVVTIEYDSSRDIETGDGFDIDVGEGFDVHDGADADVTVDADVPHVDPWECAPDLELTAVGYAHLAEQEGLALWEGLRDLVVDHRSLGYDLARNEMFRHIDVDEDAMIECIYSGRLVRRDGTRTPDGFNTEHTWPQSRGANVEPSRSDIHHLFPIDEITNQARGNFEFGWVTCEPSSCAWAEGGSLLGPATDGRGTVFQVRPERRGNVARAILYVSLRYEFEISEREEVVLREWNCTDPPDERERARNDEIETRQRNRNPFVDRPDLVDRVAEFRN
ncbi:MAG: endonuclease I family protein [Bradymonadaceae bacterium]